LLGLLFCILHITQCGPIIDLRECEKMRAEMNILELVFEVHTFHFVDGLFWTILQTWYSYITSKAIKLRKFFQKKNRGRKAFIFIFS